MVILWWPLVRPMSILFRQLHISYVYLSHTRILIIILKSNNIMTIIIWVMLFLKVVGEYGLAYKHQFRKQILLLHIKIALFKMTKLILSWSFFFLCPLIRSVSVKKFLNSKTLSNQNGSALASTDLAVSLDFPPISKSG